MSGHNKWSQIKHKKAKTDAAKSKIFGKFGKLITEEARKSNGDKNSPGLKSAIERAKASNMPNDSIERAIKKATEEKTALESIAYEAYGPGGVAIIIEALTNNRNKAAQEVKHILSQNGISLASPGSASWAFTKDPESHQMIAQTTVDLSEEDLNKLSILIDALEENDEVQEVFTNAE